MRIQKGKVRFSKRDLWNLDETLKPILRTALTQFRDAKKMGVSTLIYKDYIANERGITIDEAAKWIKEHLDQYGNVKGYDLNVMCDYFHNVILEDMIFAFSDHPDYCDIEKQPYKIHIKVDDWVGTNGCRKSFIEYVWDDGITQDDVNSYHNRETEYRNKVQERCERGRLLFARYFNSLWD